MSTLHKTVTIEPRQIRDIQDLVDSVAMSDVQFYELTSTRNESGKDVDDAEIHPSFVLQIGHPSDGIGVRLAIEITIGRGTIRADAGVIYHTTEKEDLISVSEEIGLEFVNRVGVLALMPYLREAIANISLRVLGTPITLPMLRAGQLTFHATEIQEPEAP